MKIYLNSRNAVKSISEGLKEMDDELKISMRLFTLDCIAPYELAKSYARCLSRTYPFLMTGALCLALLGAHYGIFFCNIII